MALSIDFIRPIQTALAELKTLCMPFGVVFTREEDVNKGAGVKLHGTLDNQPVVFVLYFNRSKGTSSKVVLEKIPEDKKALSVNSVSSGSSVKKLATKAIPIHASITIADIKNRQAIRESLVAAKLSVTECVKPSHADYLVKVHFAGHDLTMTQYSSGVLLLQGGYSDLVEQVVEIIDKVKPLSTEERALLYVPEGAKEIVQATITQGTDVFEHAHAIAQSAADDYVAFLFENDRKSLVTGEGLTEILAKHPTTLPEYNFLVAIYAKVFEGFLIKVLIHKGFFSLEDYATKPDIADIGNALRKRKLEKYIKDKVRFGYVVEDLISVWEGCRCKEMHSDPVATQEIISIGSLDDAENRVGKIKACMKDAYNVLVKHGYAVEDLMQKGRVPQPLPTAHIEKVSPIIQNGYIGTDESGKGDYFGPLVIAGVYLDPETEKTLGDAGVRDSKKISDQSIYEFAKMIRSHLNKSQYSVVAIGPDKYNELYDKIGNLNRLLAWGHARAIENILAAVECEKAIADQFGDESYIKRALLEKGKDIELVQMPKAEKHTAVAAASILAREAFLVRLAELSRECGMQLPKGASAEVENTARRVVQERGMSQLTKCAKLHFKTTAKLQPHS